MSTSHFLKTMHFFLFLILICNVQASITKPEDLNNLSEGHKLSMRLSAVRIIVDPTQHDSWGTGSFVQDGHRVFIATARHCVKKQIENPDLPLRVLTDLFVIVRGKEGSAFTRGKFTFQALNEAPQGLPPPEHPSRRVGEMRIEEGPRSFSRDQLKFYFSPSQAYQREDWCLIEFLNEEVKACIRNQIAAHGGSLPCLSHDIQPDLQEGKYFVCANTKLTRHYSNCAVSLTKGQSYTPNVFPHEPTPVHQLWEVKENEEYLNYRWFYGQSSVFASPPRVWGRVLNWMGAVGNAFLSFCAPFELFPQIISQEEKFSEMLSSWSPKGYAIMMPGNSGSGLYQVRERSLQLIGVQSVVDELEDHPLAKPSFYLEEFKNNGKDCALSAGCSALLWYAYWKAPMFLGKTWGARALLGGIWGLRGLFVYAATIDGLNALFNGIYAYQLPTQASTTFVHHAWARSYFTPLHADMINQDTTDTPHTTPSFVGECATELM